MTSTTTIADVASKISGVSNRGAWTSTPTSSGKVTVPKGYHNGSGYVDTSKVYSAGQTAGSSGKSNVVNLGTGTSFNVSSYSGYKNFTASNFIISIVKTSTSASTTDADAYNGAANIQVQPTISYNSSTGNVTVNNVSASGSFKTWGSTGHIVTITVSCKVYLVY